MRHTTLAFVLLTSSVAAAQPAGQPMFGPAPMVPAPDAPDPLRSPGFVMIDRFDANSRAGAEMSYLILDRARGDGTALRFDVHGHYVDPASGFGGYANLPMSYLSGGNESHFELAGAEIGALFTKRLSPEIGIVARAGVVLPTAGDDLGAMIQNAVASYARPTDIASVYPNTTIRLSGSPMFRSGQLFARVDVGFDILTDSDDTGNNALLRLGPGIGFDGGTFAVMGELDVFRGVGDNDGDETSSFAAVSARFTAGTMVPYAAVVFPIDEDLRTFVDAAVTLGVEAKL